MKKTKILALLLALAMVLSMMACATPTVDEPAPEATEAVTEQNVPEENPETEAPAENNGEKLVVRVGDFLGETFLYPVKIANQMGFFEEEFGKDNIEISIEYLGSGAVMVEALTAGELEMSFLGGQPTFSGIANGNGVKVVSMATVSITDPCLLVAANSDITDVSQLKGKNLAVNIGTDNHYQLLEMLALGGLTEDDINLFNLKGQDAFAALVNGEIDCMQSIAPNTYKFVNAGDAKILATLEQTGGRNNQVLVATEDFMANHSDIIVRFLKVLQKALDYYAENTEACNDMIAEYVGADRALMDDYMSKYDCSLHLNQQDKDYMERVYNFLIEKDMLTTAIDLDTIYNDTFLVEAFGTADVH